MEDSALVIAGDWLCREFGEWRFRVSRNEMAKFVGLTDDISYERFLTNVVEAFHVDLKMTKPCLSFVYEAETTVFTQAKMPPVSITSDGCLRKFKNYRIEKNRVNMFLNLESLAADVVPVVGEDEGDLGVGGKMKPVGDDLLVAHLESVQALYKAKVGGRKGKDKVWDDNMPLGDKNVEKYCAGLVGDIVGNKPLRAARSESSERLVSASTCGRRQKEWAPDDGDVLSLVDKPSRVGFSETVGPMFKGNNGGQKEKNNAGDVNMRLPYAVSMGDKFLDNSAIHKSDGHCDTFGGNDDSFQSEEDYDCDRWTDLINTDYPPDWDPFEEANIHSRKRNKLAQLVNGGQELVVQKAGEPEKEREFEKGGPSSVMQSMELVVVNSIGETVGEKGIESNVHTFSSIGFNLLSCELFHDGGQHHDENVNGEEELLVAAVGDGIGEKSGQVVLSTLVPVENVIVSEGMIVGDCSTGTNKNFSYDDDVFVEDSLLFSDCPPVRDNMKRLPSDKANMDLRKSAADSIYVGKVFANKEEFRKTLSMYAIKRVFHFRMGKSDKKRAIAICADESCGWRVYAKNHLNSANLEIRKVCLKHTCDVATRSKYGKNASAQILADIMKSKFAHGKKGPRACDIPAMLLSEVNVTISYMKAWQSKKLAVSGARGSEEGSYKFLSTYLHLLKVPNPGTISSVDTVKDKDGNTLFKYLFFALGGSIAGLKYLRKVIVIDGTALKGKYKGCLVAASGQDGNMQIFPLGFGVVDGENEAGWVWFFKQLSAIIPDEEDLVFVSDIHAAIYAGLRTVYPLVRHGACAVHLN